MGVLCEQQFAGNFSVEFFFIFNYSESFGPKELRNWSKVKIRKALKVSHHRMNKTMRFGCHKGSDTPLRKVLSRAYRASFPRFRHWF
jgi:hypothetical protein